MRRHERPLPRVNPSGRKVWIARFTNAQGQRRSAGTFEVRGPCKEPLEDGGCCAQHKIDASYDTDRARPARPDTVGAFAESWLRRHPRSARTNQTYGYRLASVLDVELEGRAFRDWQMADVRRRQALELVNDLLAVQGRAASGAQGVIVVLSGMFENAMDDEVCELNPFRGVKVKASDPRVQKGSRVIRSWSWEQMHGFAAAAATATTSNTEETTPWDAWRPTYAEPMVRLLSDCGLRIGELLPLYRTDVKRAGRCDEQLRGQPCPVEVPHVHIQRTAHEGVILAGTKTDHGKADAGRVAPLPPALEALLWALPRRIDTPLLFTGPRGKILRERSFYRDLWEPAREATGLAMNPHEMRHAYVTLIRATAGVDDADLAAIAGHTVQTMLGRYTHSLGRSFDAVMKAVGE